MTNSISTIASTPFTGLGTQTYTVTTAGLYTISAVVWIPWITSDQPYAVANPLVMEKQTIATVADTAGSLNSTYWTFYNAGAVNGYYVWYNINSSGVDPAPAGLTGIEVSAATDATANTIASDTRAAIAAALTATSNSGNTVIVSGATNNVIIANIQPGTTTAAADGTAATGFTFTVNTVGSYGYSSGLQIQLKKNSTVLQTLSQPAPTQAMMSGAQTASCSVGDTLTAVLSSSAAVDQPPNAIKGIVNVYLGR